MHFTLSLPGVRMEGTVVEHGHSAELPTVAMAAAHYAGSALLHARPSKPGAGAASYPLVFLTGTIFHIP